MGNFGNYEDSTERDIEQLNAEIRDIAQRDSNRAIQMIRHAARLGFPRTYDTTFEQREKLKNERRKSLSFSVGRPLTLQELGTSIERIKLAHKRLMLK